MKPIIGIITRPILSEEKNQLYAVYKDVEKSISKFGGIPIGIMPTENSEETLSICDGIIFQGGDKFTDYQIKYLKYAHENNIPTLGICLGMQMMGIYFGATEYEVNKHKDKNKKYVHKILIDENSLLFSIIRKKEIYVNSRHKYALKQPKIDISAVSLDGIIEAIEDKKKKFFIGLEWHPESMIEYDESSRKIFKYFIDITTP